MSIRNRITQFVSTVLSTRIRCTKGEILLGRKTTGAGYAEEITIGTGLELTSGKVLNATSVGATNLTATASPTGVVIASDTGTDATIAAASETNAGLMLPAEKTKLASIEQAPLAFAGSDPNEGIARITGTLSPDVTGDLNFIGENGTGGLVWSNGDNITPLVGDTALAVYLADYARLGLYEYAGPSDPPAAGDWWTATNSGDAVLDFAGTMAPGGGSTGIATLAFFPLTATHLGQFCQASTAWWQWNGTLWQPIRLLTGEPITTDGTNYYAITHDGSSLGYTPFP